MTQRNLSQSSLTELLPLLKNHHHALYRSQRRKVYLLEQGDSLLRLGERDAKPLQLSLLAGEAQDFYQLYAQLNATEAPPPPRETPDYLDQESLVHDAAFLSQGWQSLFAQERPLSFELGCGYGHFMEGYAPTTERNFIAVDIVSKVLRRASKRLQDLPNVRVAKLDGIFALKEWMPAQQLEQIFILFPDPWPKERHQNRRSVRPATLQLLANALKEGGQLLFVSDEKAYAEQVRELLDACPYFAHTAFPEIAIRSKYERKWRKQDKEIFHLAFARVAHPDLRDKEPWQALNLEHLPRFDLDPESFQHWTRNLEQQPVPWDITAAPFTLKINDLYVGSEAVLMRLIIAEPDAMAQAIWLKLDQWGQLSVCPYSAFPYLQRQEQIYAAIQELLQPHLRVKAHV